jgi:arylsulfatase A-like enzyme
VAEQVRQVDIMPTLLDLVGIVPPAGISGRSLRPLVEGKDKGLRPAYVETYGFGRDPKFFMRGLRVPEWKYIDSPTDLRVKPQLYDLKQDPREMRNVIQQNPQIVAQLQALLSQETSLTRPERESEAWTDEESAIVEERLRNLGYF